MFTEIHAQNFKSWRDTGKIKLAPLTGFFGSNSSGKTSLLQILLVWKQTIESNDRSRILDTGWGNDTYVNLGSIYDVVHQHELVNGLYFLISGREFFFPATSQQKPKLLPFTFSTQIKLTESKIFVERFTYDIARTHQLSLAINPDQETLVLTSTTHSLPNFASLSPPRKSYDFPDEVSQKLKEFDGLRLEEFVINFERLFKRIRYLGPVRAYMERSYIWSGELPRTVGVKGEYTVPILLGASHTQSVAEYRQLMEKVSYWLKELKLIDSFRLKQISEGQRHYELLVKQTPNSAEVPITDVGFGVSQILPVLTMCYSAEAGSTIILEQPEIHLHPAVQAGLADVFIDVIKTRRVQIIVESHSEHLLRRLQRRMAEGELAADDTALYFAENRTGESHLTQLEVDDFGNIHNWPANFFGDEMGDLIAMTEAAVKRQMEGKGA